MNHDVFVLGASAGGVPVLLQMASELPTDFPGSIFVVLHRSAENPDLLPKLLSERGRLPARHPLHGEHVAPGTIYVAPPDNHLWLRPGTIDVVRGPKENGHRPAVDALFRTASSAYGPRVVGVVLSGYQDCGTAGMMSIKARGGKCVVQAPASAAAADMPASVLKAIEVDHIVDPGELARLLMELAFAPTAEPQAPDDAIRRLEGDLAGSVAEVVCPLCDGVLREATSGVVKHFRCHVGHAFTLESLVREQGEALERALWAAVRALEESAALGRRLVTTEKNAELRARFEEKALTALHQADVIRQMLLRSPLPSASDAFYL